MQGGAESPYKNSLKVWGERTGKIKTVFKKKADAAREERGGNDAIKAKKRTAVEESREEDKSRKIEKVLN